MQAAILTAKGFSQVQDVLLDGIPLFLGLKTVSGVLDESNRAQRNISHRVRQTFTMYANNQPGVLIQVFVMFSIRRHRIFVFRAAKCGVSAHGKQYLWWNAASPRRDTNPGHHIWAPTQEPCTLFSKAVKRYGRRPKMPPAQGGMQILGKDTDDFNALPSGPFESIVLNGSRKF